MTTMTVTRIARNLVVLVFFVSFAADGVAALPTISMHNDLIGNHFALPHSDISNKARYDAAQGSDPDEFFFVL